MSFLDYRRTRRDWAVSLSYVAAVVTALLVREATGVSWYAFAAFYVVTTAAVVVYYYRVMH